MAVIRNLIYQSIVYQQVTDATTEIHVSNDRFGLNRYALVWYAPIGAADARAVRPYEIA